MKKGIGTIIISFLVLIVIGVGLYFWAYHPAKQEVAEKNKIERLTEEQTGGWQSKEKQLSEKENNSSSIKSSFRQLRCNRIFSINQKMLFDLSSIFLFAVIFVNSAIQIIVFALYSLQNLFLMI